MPLQSRASVMPHTSRHVFLQKNINAYMIIPALALVVVVVIVVYFIVSNAKRKDKGNKSEK